MGKWMDRLIYNHTCKFCDKKLNKKEIYTVNIDTVEGPHTFILCEICADDFNEMLKAVEEGRNELFSE